ncbi:MAG: type IV pilus twitching motility protein PilT [Blastocatellia bacterium]|nr:type IV pilus twitching motility protein PilT [Blastocatellia bacterium]MBN8721311.1 type IV pilus twitching motility protein PilT [Acidobacteriota bacterium]
MSVQIDELLMIACSKGASDLHIKAGSYPFIRINGELQPIIESQRLTQEDTLAMAFSMMSNRQKQRFKEHYEVDIAYGVSGLGRFRCNIFQQRGTVGMVLRVIPTAVQTVEELRLPKIIETISEERRGLVLVTGTTGSGKSTTLAAMIDYINSTRTSHVITVEDPIEFLHRDKKSYINQREVDVDTRSFSEALRGALRQDPDVILVGEMRDYETIETALTAAETGHLVMSTLHTLDATETITRIVSIFPPHQQKAIRLQLASVLKAVISMRLIRCADMTARVPAAEVLISTPYIRDCICNQEKTSLVRDAIAQGTSQYGMQTFDQSLHELYAKGYIGFEEALAGATNRDEFILRIRGVQSSADQAREELARSFRADDQVNRY